MRHLFSQLLTLGTGRCKSFTVLYDGSLIRNSEFNPPAYTLAAYREALRDVDCNQYGPTMVRHSDLAPSRSRSSIDVLSGPNTAEASTCKHLFCILWTAD